MGSYNDSTSGANALSIAANFKPVNWRHTRILQRQHPSEEPDYRNIQAYDEVHENLDFRDVKIKDFDSSHY